MTLHRRQLLAAAGIGSLAGTLGSLSGSSRAAGAEYRALVVVYLNGGNDGHNVLIPIDGGYGDYQAARQNLAIPKASVAALPGSSGGRSFGLHPALAPLVPLYGSGRLAAIANVGPLVRPATARQVLDRTVEVPPFLGSHSDQTSIVQGWMVSDGINGWAGRGLEALPAELQNDLAAVTFDTNRTLVLGRHSPVTNLPLDGGRDWTWADLKYRDNSDTLALNRLARLQSTNAYEAEYANSLAKSLADSAYLVGTVERARLPEGDFGPSDNLLGQRLRTLASLLPLFKSDGLRRQVFLLHWGSFDTHAAQRGSDPGTQDAQLATVGKALSAFDAANRAAGVDMNVTTLVMTEFGRTVRPASGGGSEHGWGNHWLTLGGPVAGGVVGTFPSLVLGGPDDGDRNKNGRHVPTTSVDQVGATLMQWLGLEASAFHEVFPNLANFDTKTIPLLRL